MGRFRKKPVEVEAVHFLHENRDEVKAFLWHHRGTWHVDDFGNIVMSTLEGMMTASVGDWIIRGVAGEIYPCKPEIFEATYEPVAD